MESGPPSPKIAKSDNASQESEPLVTFLPKKRLVAQDVQKDSLLKIEGYKQLRCYLEVENSCLNINAQEPDGSTALHHAVSKNCLKSVQLLLCYGANVNVQNSLLRTPLHLAGIYGREIIMMELISWKVNLELRDNNNNSARHYAAQQMTDEHARCVMILCDNKARRCATPNTHCTFGCCSNGSDPPPSVTQKECSLMDALLHKTLPNLLEKRRVAGFDDERSNSMIFTIDGGGVKGLSAIQIMMIIEEKFGGPLSDVIDLYSGTSTGGFLALYLNTGHSLTDAQRFYMRHNKKLFSSRPCSSELIKKILIESFGEKTMGDILYPRVAITATSIGVSPGSLTIFRNYASADEIAENSDVDLTTLIRTIAQDTTAAPSFFPRQKGSTCIDGGLLSNNPTLDTMMEFHFLKIALNEQITVPSMVVSIGTGIKPESIRDLSLMDIELPTTIADILQVPAKTKEWVKLLVELLTLKDGPIVNRAKAWCSTINASYHRLTSHLSYDVKLNETSAQILTRMRYEARVYALNSTDLDEVVSNMNLLDYGFKVGCLMYSTDKHGCWQYLLKKKESNRWEIPINRIEKRINAKQGAQLNARIEYGIPELEIIDDEFFSHTETRNYRKYRTMYFKTQIKTNYLNSVDHTERSFEWKKLGQSYQEDVEQILREAEKLLGGH